MITENEIFFLNYLKINFEEIDFVDVGGNFGEFTKVVESTIKVRNGFIFEPVKKCYDHLKNMFTENRYKIYNYALGSVDGHIDFNEIVNEESFSSIIPRNWLYSTRNFKVEKKNVEIHKLDSVLNTQINFLKIDVEGYELEVLKGCSKLLEKNLIDFIQFEYGGTFKDCNVTINQVIDFFGNYGYSVYDIKNNQFVKIEKLDDTYEFNNYYATKKNII